VGNSAALLCAGVSASSAGSVEGGSVELGADGAPTGVLRERAADAVHALLGEPSPSVRKSFLREAVWQCAAAGLTCVHTHEFGEGWSAAEAWDVYAQLQAEGDLPLRVELTTSSDEEGRPPPGEHPAAALLHCGRAKIFGDGSLGAETAALRSDYIQELNATSGANRGQMIFEPDELAQRVRGAAVEGYRLEVHAIGDAAAEAVLDAFDAELGPPLPATEAPLSSRARPVLTHCQVLGDDLIARMAALGVVANIQPSFVATDARFVSQRLAASVHRTSYCWRSLLAAGVWCAGGSDAPVELPWPLLGMHDAMARAARPEGGGAAERAAAPAARDIFLPEERLPFAAALWLYTVGGAYAIGEEATLGALARGRRADFVIISERGGDVTADPTGAALLLAQADETWVDGVRRYQRAATADAATAAGGGAAAATPTADPNSAGRHGPSRAPAAIGAGGCPCCFGQAFADALKRARRPRAA